jgi:type III secretory pathway component EscS
MTPLVIVLTIAAVAFAAVAVGILTGLVQEKRRLGRHRS